MEQITVPQKRGSILKIEEEIGNLPNAMKGDCFPLEHKFLDGCYVRKITIPKGYILTSKIHKVTHPYFVLEGDVSVLTEKGIQRIKAPYFGVTQAGTKRVLYTHSEVVWYTVHVTDETDLVKIEEQIIAKTFKECGLDTEKFMEHITKEDL